MRHLRWLLVALVVVACELPKDVVRPPSSALVDTHGVRHAAREKGCVLLAADWSKQLFDVAQMRTIRYPLADGEVGEAAAQAIRAAIKPKIEALAKGGSPVFESITWISLVSSYSTTTTKFATSSADEVLTADIRICWCDGAPSNGGTISRTSPRRRLCGSGARRTGSNSAIPEVTLLLSTSCLDQSAGYAGTRPTPCSVVH